MKQVSAALGLLLAVLIMTVVSCDSNKPPEPKATSGSADTSTMADGPIMSTVSSPGRADNDEGVSHYKQAHWDVAADHFQKAIKADPKLGEAQYNLGLSLDKMGKHEEATAAFKQAVALAPANPAIKDSSTVKKHLGM